MKELSASIVVLAGAIVVSAGAFAGRGDVHPLVCLAGVILAIVGLVGWFSAMNRGGE